MRRLIHIWVIIAGSAWALTAEAQVIFLQEPVNNQELINTRPFFDWSDVSGADRYFIKIVQPNPGQSLSEAIMNNAAVHQSVVYGHSNYLYPGSATPLEACEEYAWVVYTVAPGNISQHELGNVTSYVQYISAPSRFEIRCTEPAAPLSFQLPFYELSPEISPFIHEVSDDSLRIKFHIPYNTAYVQYKVIDAAGLTLQGSDSLAVNYGVNYVTIRLGNAVVAGEPLQVIVYNGKGRNVQGKFLRKED